ncbi:histidine kinase dimerization/phosphoacceptor domain -containing protein [Pelagibacterium sp.]|uniref:histidine kinase dimerization/phosphoacceptor domain -containing protein n=1 Tax=Pelagibacterium sp. TaxID=1967288 RepID=UPI003A8D100A
MPNTPANILYVDDDPALGRLVQRVLGREGREIIHVTCADEGFERLAVGDIDVLVLDHYLGDGTGLGMLEQVAAGVEAPPVVYVTGSTEAAIAVSALKAGAADYVLKTVGEDFLELLSNAVEQAIMTSRLRKSREQAERELRAAKERAELALAEVNHRVANSLALVAALVRLQASAVADPAAKEALAETQGRISAIAGIHKRLYTTDDVRFVEIDSYLGNLASEIQASMSLDGSAADIKLVAEPIRIPTDKAVSVGVIVNELVTNAAKYAYRDREVGEIRVKASQVVPGTFEIIVEDDGIGWTGEGKVHGTGVGSRVIAATASGLGASLNYEAVAQGTRARLQIEI